MNDDPVAATDGVTATEDTDLAIDAADLLANDSDVDGDEIGVTAVHDASGGTVALDDTTITFSPAANLCGPAAGGFEYDISDGNGGSFTGSVTVDITCVNDDPVAADDAVSGTEDEPLTVTEFDMLNNDDDIDSGALTLAGVSNVTGGSAEVDGVDVDFTPAADECGPGAAGYDYTVEDGDGGSAVAHVTIDLTCVNDNPTAGDDTVTVDEDSADNDVTGDILHNDSDIDDGDTVHVSDVSNATGGSVALDGETVTFTPDAGACGDGYGSFDYEISDGNGGTANGHAEVNVTCDNDAPVATDDAKTGTEDTDLVLTNGFLTGNDSDTEDDNLTVTSVANLVGGTASVDDGDVTFHPTANRCGTGAGSFDYTVDDGHGGVDTGHVVIDLDCVNDAPVGVDDAGLADENSAAADYDVLHNDSDVEHDTLTLVSVLPASSLSAPSPGTASVHGDMVRFVPAPMFHGQAVITYTVSDGEDTSTATLTVTVGPDVDAPVVAKPTVAFGKGRVNERAPLLISWSAFDAGVGVKSYQVQVSVAGAAWKSVYTGPKTSVTKLYPFRKSLVWRVRATDNEGNTSGWVTSAKRRIATIQNGNASVKYAGNWHGIRLRASSGRGYTFATDKGSRATAAFKGRSVLYVAPKTKLSGFVKVYVDGALIGTYKLRHGTFVNGSIVARFSWAANGRHRIRIVNSVNGRRTNFDAFIVLK